ncbi:hypothetical protein LDENG_00108680 [Lucifuga dentata]|nr:hypothetical protein LDENG_00108680 [Lucifuga dentata]
MMSARRSRTVSQRMNADNKDRQTLHHEKLLTPANTTVIGCDSVLSRLHGDRRRGSPSDATSEVQGEANPVVSAIRRGDVEAVNHLAASTPHSLVRENKDGWISLHDAAFCGETECLKTLLRAHPGLVDKRTLKEQTALLLAVSGEHLSCVQCLLEAGADPDISNNDKKTPLYKACELENMDMVSLILSYGVTVNQRCGQGWTAFHEAVSRNNIEICEILLKAGAKINPPNTYSIAPLIVAAQRGQLRALCYLIGKGADVNIQACDGTTALYEASKKGHKETVVALLTKNADANKPSSLDMLPLHIAAQYGHHEIVSLLVSVTSQASLRLSGISPLHLAAECNRQTVAAVLLKTGADVNATLAHFILYPDRRATALFFAAARGNTKTAEVLLNAGASLKLDPISPLLAAVERGCVSTVSLLLQRGADVNAGIPSYPTTFPAVLALCMDNLSLLKCLLDNGCDPLACFTCTHGSARHPGSVGSLLFRGSGCVVKYGIPLSCSEPQAKAIQFCEWISTLGVYKCTGPIIDLLLDHVGNVQLCSRLTELLDSQEEWLAVKMKTLSPRPLQHLCRLRIWTQMGRHRLRSLTSLPLPDRLIGYLSLTLT